MAVDNSIKRRLSVMAVLRDALAVVFFRYPWRVLRIAGLPFILILLLGMAASFAFPSFLMGGVQAGVILGVAGFALAFLLPLTFLNVALSRSILDTPGAGGLWLFGRRVVVCFGYSASILVGTCVLFVAAHTALFTLAVAINMMDQLSGPQDLLLVLNIAASAVALYVLARMSFVFPAVSLDQKLGPGGSWRLSKGNGARLFLVYLAIILLVSLLALAGAYLLDEASAFVLWLYVNVIPVEYHYWPGRVMKSLPVLAVAAAISCIGAALLTGASATAYAQLTGWGRAQTDVLERFD